jgi:hypothetical protein
LKRLSPERQPTHLQHFCKKTANCNIPFSRNKDGFFQR